MTSSIRSKLRGTLYGLYIGGALAMPVLWSNSRRALFEDYGQVMNYLAPRNPHPDSILWRSNYTAANFKGEILHDQAKYWGQRGIHYHQSLKAGENTLKYHDDPQNALIVNTSFGGDNAARGSVLGALLGGYHGLERFPERWIQGLVNPPPDFWQN